MEHFRVDWDESYKICCRPTNAHWGLRFARSVRATLSHNDCYLLKKSLMEKNTREREDNKLTVRSGRRRMAACEGFTAQRAHRKYSASRDIMLPVTRFWFFKSWEEISTTNCGGTEVMKNGTHFQCSGERRIVAGLCLESLASPL